MGLLDFWRRKQSERQQYTIMQMLNGRTPIFSSFGNNIYASDVVQQAIYTIVTEMKKLNPRHVVRDGYDLAPANYNDIQRVLDHPNAIMTKSDLIEWITWAVMLNYNAFIYITKQDGKLTALTPVNPQNVEFLQTPDGKIHVQMQFDGGTYILPYANFIHIKTHYFGNDLMGGGVNGQPDFGGLLKTLDMNEMLLDGVRKVLASSFAINAVVKYNTMLDDGKQEEEIRKFEQKIANSQSGILPMDLKAEIVQFNRQLQTVDDTTLKFLDDKILRFFGVPVEIVRGNYTTEQYQAFYQKTLEPLIVAYSEAFTKALFTDREIGFKNEIVFYPKELIFMSTQQTLEMINLLGQSGTLYENEKRVALGLEPLEELKGVRLQSLNYVDVSIAKEYQMGNISAGAQKGNEDNG